MKAAEKEEVSHAEKVRVTKKFFKDAFVLDGEVNLGYDPDDFVITQVVQLNDSKRGTFYLGLVKPRIF